MSNLPGSDKNVPVSTEEPPPYVPGRASIIEEQVVGPLTEDQPDDTQEE